MAASRPGQFFVSTGAFRGKWIRYRAVTRDQSRRAADCCRCGVRTVDAGDRGWYYSREVRRYSRQLCSACAATLAA